MNLYELDSTKTDALRKEYSRSVRLDFVVKSQPFICLNDMDKSGGLAPSAAFYKAVDGKPEQFIFWVDRPVTDDVMAKYVFSQFFEKDGLDVANAGAVLQQEKVGPTKRRFAYQHNTKSLVEGKYASDSPGPLSYGILRLENERDCCDSYGIEDIQDNDLPQLGKPESITALNFSPFGVSRLAWLGAEGEFVKGDYVFDYEMIDKGSYEVVAEDATHKDLFFEGEKIKGLMRLDMADNQIKYIGSEITKTASKPVSQLSDVYDDMGVDTGNLGCIMLNTDPLMVDDVIDENDLYFSDVVDSYAKGIVSQDKAHVTLLYGLMCSGTDWQPYVDAALDGWEMDSVQIKGVSVFPNAENGYDCIVALVEVTPEIQEGNARLRMLPHIDTFPDYTPHITLAYVNQGDTTDGYVQQLNAKYAGKTVNVTGLNYGSDNAS